MAQAASRKTSLVAPLVVNLAEASRLLSVSPSGILNMEKAGIFPGRVLLGPGRYGYSFAELKAWAEERIAVRDDPEKAATDAIANAAARAKPRTFGREKRRALTSV